MAGEDIFKAIGAILILIIFIPVFATLTSLMKPVSCSDCENKVTQLNSEIARLNAVILELNHTAEFYREQYDNLTNTSVTKKDFSDIQEKIGLILIQLNNTKTEVYNVYQQIVNIQNINNIRIALSFFISINFALFSLTIIDILFFRAKFMLTIAKKFYSWRNKTEVKITVNSTQEKTDLNNSKTQTHS